MKSIIKLPENVKRVNNLSFAYQARFIVMNANIGELYLWALLNDGSYGKVMYLDLDHEFTSTYITPDLDFFLLASPLKISFQYFDPLSEPLDYYTIPTATKVLLGDHKEMYMFDHENFVELNRMLVISKDIVVYLRPNQIFALDLNNDERFRTEDFDGSFKSHVIKSGSVRCFHSVELEPNRTWLIYLLYTKVGYVSYYDGDESVFEIYCLTSDAPDPEINQTPVAEDILERTTTLIPQNNLLSDEEASRYRKNVKQMKRNIRFGRVYEAVVPSSRPLNIKYAENVVIVHSKDDPMASCIKTFPAPKGTKKDNMCWMMRKRFNLFDTLGIRNLESTDGFLNLLNRDYGAIRPSSPEEKEAWLNENQEVSKPKEPGMEFDFANSTNAVPVLLNRASIQVIKKDSPTSRKAGEQAKGPVPRIIAAEPDLAGQVAKFFEEKDLLTDPEEALDGGKSAEAPKNKRSQDFSASRESIGGDRHIDQDSLDEGYNEMKITGIANHTGVKRPTAGAWYFFKISDILGGNQSRITVKKMVHIVHSKFAKLSPDSSLLMLYGYKGYELFRFYELDRANQEISMTDKPDYRVTEAENLPNLIRRLI